MEVVIAYGLGLLLLAGLAILFYTRAVGSRRWYSCPQCGERMRVELMDARRCNVCGAPLTETEY